MRNFFSLLFITLTLLSPAQNGNIYLIEEKLSTYSFSCPPGQFVGLSADKMSLHFYDIEKQQLQLSKDLPLPGQQIQSSSDGSLHVITHDSYVTIVKDNNMQTYSVPSIQSSSIAILSDLVCITPTVGESTLFICLNLKNASDSWHNCKGYASDGAKAYVNTAKGWVYTSGEIQKYNLSENHQCLEHIYTNPMKHSYGDWLWFSYDGSRIFTSNGMTWTADEETKPHGDFNASIASYYTYNYFSQSSIPPYNVAGIRTDTNSTIYYYGWPYLMPVSGSAKSVPLPPQARGVAAEEVHVCDNSAAQVNTTYVVANYTLESGATKTAVVTMN